MKKIMEKYKIIVLLVIGISILIILCNFSLCTYTIGFFASTKEYLALEIADRGYSNNYNGAGGQIITIDISGSTSSNTSSNSNNTSAPENNTSTTAPVQNTTTKAPSNSENNSNNNSSNNSVSFGSSTSIDSSTVSPINTPSDNNSNSSSNVTNDILSNISSSEEIGKVLEFSSSMATVKVKSDNDINQSLNLRANKLLLGYSLQKQLGGDNEYFELYLSKGINEKVEFSGKEFDLSINIDPEKEFLGFYEVIDDASLKIVGYNKTDNNTLELQTTNLGKYIICYKESEISNEVQDNNVSIQQPPSFEEANTNNSNNNLIWIIAITLCSLLIFGIAAIVIFKKFVL